VKPGCAQDGPPRTRWEHVASTKWGAYVSKVEGTAILRAHNFAREAFRRQGSAVEIGCDGGRWSCLLAELGWNMVCTEVKPESLQVCRERIPTAKCILVRGDEARLPCESNSIQLLVCIEVPSVINSDWFVDEAFRVLQGGGILVGMFWNQLSLRGLFGHLKSSWSGALDFYAHAYPAWRRTLSHRGFDLLYEEGYCWFPFRRDSGSVLVPYFTNMERRLRLNKCITASPWVAFVAAKREPSSGWSGG